MNILHVKSIEVGKISAHPHPTLCVQFLNRENNDKNNTQILCVRRSFWRFLPFLLVYHRCYSVIRRRCQTIQPLLPYSSAHSSACGQNILFLQSSHQNFSSMEHTDIQLLGQTSLHSTSCNIPRLRATKPDVWCNSHIV